MNTHADFKARARELAGDRTSKTLHAYVAHRATLTVVDDERTRELLEAAAIACVVQLRLRALHGVPVDNVRAWIALGQVIACSAVLDELPPKILTATLDELAARVVEMLEAAS